MAKIYPTEKILTCAQEAIKVWELAELLNAAVGDLIRKPSPEAITAVQNRMHALVFANPKKSYYYRDDILHGQHAKNAERMRKYRDSLAVKALVKPEWTESHARQMWSEFPGATQELFTKFKDKILSDVNARRFFEDGETIFEDLVRQCQGLDRLNQ